MDGYLCVFHDFGLLSPMFTIFTWRAHEIGALLHVGCLKEKNILIHDKFISNFFLELEANHLQNKITEKILEKIQIFTEK